LVWSILLVIWIGTLIPVTAQKAGSPYLAATIHSPFEISQKQINQLEQLCDSIYKSGKTDSALLTPLLELVNKYISFNPIKGMERAIWGSQLAEKQELWGMASLFHTARGNILRYRGYRDLALDAYIKSYAFREKQDNPELYVFGLVDIGNIYYDQAAYDKAFDYYQKALDSAIAKNYPYGQSVVLNNIGIIHRELGAFNLAEFFFLRSAAIRLKSGFYGLTAHSKNYVAGLRYRTGRFAEGLMLTQDIIDTMQKYNMYSELADIYCSKARFLQALNRPEEADKALEDSWEILVQFNMLERLEFHYLIQAEIAISRKQLERAKLIIDKVIEQARSIDNLQGEIRAYDMLYRMYKNANQPLLALGALEKYHAARDNVKKQEVDRKLLAMENNLILQRQQRELNLQKAALLQREQLLAAKQTQNRLLLLLVLSSLAGISIIATMLLKQRRTNKALLSSQQLIEAQNKQMIEQNEELRLANELAAKHLRAKTDFMSHMSHEIRTPMNSIMGLTELLQEEVSNKDILDKLQSIRYSADVLLVIINDILDLATIEEGKLNLEFKPVSIRQIVHELSNLIMPKLLPKGIKLLIEVDDDLPPYVAADTTRLVQILLNLLGNAAKFTEQGSIRFSVKTLSNDGHNCRIAFEISDTGPGIKSDILPTIFDSFSQGGSEIHKKFGGTGLGLTITKKLVELLGGTILVHSEFGEGSTFTVNLLLPLADTPTNESSLSTTGSHADLTGLNVLYVEDNMMNQKVMGLLLKQYNLNLTFANNGLEGLSELNKSPFDLVLMDLRMPILDGYEATVKIRAGEAGSHHSSVPIIAVTADAFDDSTRRALELGMNDILVKPLSKEKLLQVLVKYGQIRNTSLLNPRR